MLALVSGILLAVSPVRAQDLEEDDFDDFEELYLGDLLDTVVSSARHEQDIAESASAVTVITREQIENTACDDVICLLRGVPGVDVFRTTPVFVGSGARAMSDLLGDRVVVFMDGREINNDFYGFPLYQALPAHMDDIERIEVIRGPGSALYGANAHSLVVTITSRTKAEKTAEVVVGAGERGRQSTHLRLGAALGSWHLLLTGGNDHAGHWTDRDIIGREIFRARLQAVREAGDDRTLLQAGVITLQGDFFADLAPLQVRDGVRAFFLASHQTGWYQARLSGDIMQGDYTLDLPLVYQGIKIGEAPGKLPARNIGLDAEVLFSHSFFEGNLLMAGLNYRLISLFAEDNVPDEVFQHRAGAFIQGEQKLFERLTLTAGGRLDVNSITPISFSPRAAAVLQVTEDQFARLAFGMAFRKPTLFNTSLHIKGIRGEPGFEILGEFFERSIGSDELDNESITSLEAGYTARFLEDRLTAEAVGFYQRYRDPITSHIAMQIRNGLPDLANSVLIYDNSGRETDTAGGTLSLTYRTVTGFRVHLNYTYRYTWYIADSEGMNDPTADIGKGGRYRREPAHLFKAGLHYLSGIGLRLGGSFWARSDSRGDLNQNGSPFEPRIIVDVPAAAFFNAFAAWREEIGSGSVEIGVKAYNLFNLPFRDVPTVTRFDGTEMGGQLIGRRMFVFLRGAL
jgi:iron complex outermembrane receptor protein